MNKHDIARRFAALPFEARKTFIEALKKNGIDFARLPIVPAARDAALPLSLAQQRLWFLSQMEPGNSAYHIPAMLRLDGQLDLAALQQSLDTLVARHEVLRTTFRSDEAGNAEQRIAAPAPVVIVHTDLSTLTERETEAQRLAEADTLAPFDLSAGPLLRARLVKLADDAHRLILVQHHIVSDGWSVDVLVRELAEAYRAHLERREPAFVALPIQYADYAVWQRHWLDAGERERQLAYWQEQLGAEHPLLALPLDRPRQAVRNLAGARHALRLDAAISDALRALAQREGATLFMVLLAAFQAQLARHAGSRDVRVGVSVAGRGRAETEHLAGFFVGTQVLAARCEPRDSFRTLLAQVKARALGAQAHADLPFDELVDALGVERSLSHNPLVQVKFTQQIALPAAIALPGLGLSPLPLPDHAARFDLSLDVTDLPDGIEAVFSYATALFDATTIARFAASFVRFAARLVANPDASLVELTEPAGAADYALAAEHRDYAGLDVLSAWSENVAAHGVAPALRDEDRVLSFAELDAASNRLARHLQARGITTETRVGLIAERSIEFVLGLLSVLKAGGAYVPVDPKLPADRVAYQLEDSGVRCVLVGAGGAGLAAGCEAVSLVDAAAWGEESDAPLAGRPQPGQAAYVIYTSGSTGRPKGVVVEHGALADYVFGMLVRLDFAPGASMAMVSTVSADLGHTTLFGALCSGRLLHLISSERAFDPDRFAAYMAEHRVGVLKIVPSHLKGLMQAATPADALPQVALVLGGEALPWTLIDEIAALRPALRVINHYGPTEATVGVLTQEATVAERARSATVPVGAPLPNAGALVLDDAFAPVPLGAVGELYLAGPGLARGYLGRADLTAERFLPHPYAIGERVYRTGDRVRLLATGAIEYLGRADDQVKIRGYRVELSEVAATLLAQPGVAEAQVFAHDAGDDRLQLVAYLVGNALDNGLDGVALKAELAKTLPDYMVPAYLIPLARMPLTANGKLDRKALPAPTAVAAQAASSATGLSETEQKLADIWCAVLRIDTVGAHDNFFALGGDSILSLQIIARARKAGLKLTPRQLFENQTVATLAKVAQPIEAKVAAAPLVAKAATVPLTPAQQAFFAADIGNRSHWNQALRFTASAPLDAGKVAGALAAVVAAHDALRLRFEARDGVWTQRVVPVESCAELLWVRGADAGIDAACDEVQRSLDIANGPLVRAVLIGESTLFVAIHHLAVDGVSWRVLIEDLETAYRAAGGQGASLADASTSWASWAERLARHAQGGALDAVLPYWQALDGASGLDPACDVPEGSAQVRDAARVTVAFDADTTQQLLKTAPAAYRTQVNDLLLTALARALGHDGELLVELEGHGRESLENGLDDVDLSRTVGWFASHFPVRLSATGALPAAIAAVKETLRAVPNKGVGFGVLKALGNQAVRDALSALPKPQVTFNYLGQFDAAAGDTLLTPVFGASGDERDGSGPLSNRLAIHGQVSAGRLELVWVYSREQYRAETVNALAAAFQRELTELIAHCADADGGVTPSDFPLARLDAATLQQLPVPARELADLYPASPMQQGLLFHALLDPAGTTYINQLTMTLSDPDIDRLEAAWQGAVDAHEILRTGFWHDGPAKPQQLVLRSAVLAIGRHDLRNQPDQQAQLAALAEDERARPFDLAAPPLMRVAVVRMSDTEYRMIWTRHHLLLDGWSTARLWAEVLRRYGQTTEATAPRARYRDYIRWLDEQDEAASRTFWQTQLSAIDEPTLLAGAFSPKAQTGLGSRVQDWSVESAAALRRFAREQRVTVNTVIQGGWALLLQRYTGRSAVTFGSTVAGRPAALSGIEDVLGLFINTLPVVEAPQASEVVGDWLRALQQRSVVAREHEHAPLFEIQRWAGYGGQALFDSLIVFENYPVEPEWAGGAALRFADVVNVESTSYPMALMVVDAETLSIEYGYDRAAFSDAEVARLATHFEQLLLAIVASGGERVGNLNMLTGVEYATRSAWLRPDERSFVPVHQRLAAQAAARGDETALLFGDGTMSWDVLNTRANRLAHRLIEAGVGAETRVGIGVERSFGMIVSLLAVLKAGGAFVPLDPDYPVERLAYMLEDAGIAHLITQPDLAERYAQPGLLSLDVDADLSGYPDSEPQVEIQPLQAAYLIYTSGSTGKPKGVTIEHGPLAMHTEAVAARFGFTDADRALHFASINFDQAHESWLMPLCSGASLLITDPLLWSPTEMVEKLMHHRVTVADLPPTYLVQVAEEQVALGEPSSLRMLAFGGEALSVEGFAAVRAAFPAVTLINGYGPTETVITPLHWASAPDADPADWAGQTYLPIGSVVGARSAYVMDAAMNLLPVGVAGELYLGGDGVARGYHARPGLTAERFVPDPFNPGGRLYRTGDLARWRNEATLEYIGRVDHQIKLRGLRIELGEIESRLLEFDGMRMAVVVALELAGGAQLAGYFVAHGPVDLDALRAHLGRSLPDYMVPAYLTQLDTMPLTPNGKVDRKALPAPTIAAREHEPPQGETELLLAAIWQRLLGVSEVGRRDNFFALGGHSLLATQVVSRLKAELAISLPLRKLFEANDLAELAGMVDAVAGSRLTDDKLDALDALFGEMELL
ncbi:amino acid adenylation domain-containing protein [Jeongeupia wiesaeckerbachi]